MKIFKFFLISVAMAGFLVSCATPRSMTILQDMEYETLYDAHPAPELVLQRGDRLGIQVMSANPQLAAPFNTGLGLVEAATAPQQTVSYTLDKDGNIEFPVLGVLHAEGHTLKQMQEIIAGEIIEQGYIKDPVVKATLENFEITVIGKLGNHVLKVKESSINLIQVLAQSKEIDGGAKIQDVSVIRTENGKRQAYAVNLKTKELFDSPVFYLQQNDVVYVKPKGTTLSPEGQVVMTFVGTGLTLTSIITNFILWSNRR